MDISRYYDSLVTITREDFVPGSTIKKNQQTVYENVPCNIQPLTEEFQQNMSGSFGKQYVMFCGNEYVVIEGDKVIAGAKTYSVTGVEVHRLGINQHTEVILSAFSN